MIKCKGTKVNKETPVIGYYYKGQMGMSLSWLKMMRTCCQNIK